MSRHNTRDKRGRFCKKVDSPSFEQEHAKRRRSRKRSRKPSHEYTPQEMIEAMEEAQLPEEQKELIHDAYKLKAELERDRNCYTNNPDVEVNKAPCVVSTFLKERKRYELHEVTGCLLKAIAVIMLIVGLYMLIKK